MRTLIGKPKKFLRFVIRSLPTQLRAPIARRLVLPNFKSSHELTIKVASNLAEVKAALKLVHDCYVGQGLMCEMPSGVRVSYFNLYPTTTTVVAIRDGEVVGTFSILVKNNNMLPSDYDFATHKIQPVDGRTAEIVGLAIKKGYRGQQGEVVFSMMKYLYEVCRKNLNVKLLQVAVSPTHAYLYRDLLLFKYVEKKIVKDQTVNGKKMKALYLNLEKAPEIMEKAYNNLPAKNNLFHYMTKFKHQGFELPSSKTSKLSLVPSLTKDEVSRLLDICNNFRSSLDEAELNTLAKVYNFPKKSDVENVSHYRLPISTYAICMENESSSLQVFDATEIGIKIISDPVFTEGNLYSLKVRTPIGLASNVSLKAECIWTRGKASGFKLINPPEAWDDYILKLRKEAIGDQDSKYNQNEVKHA